MHMLLQKNIVLAVEGRGKAATCKPDKTEGESSGSAFTPGQAATVQAPQLPNQQLGSQGRARGQAQLANQDGRAL